MDLPARLKTRLTSLSPRNLKLGAVAVLAAYAIGMLWPYLAATLVRDSAVTAWTNLATAPIQGRVQAKLPAIGSHVGADGTILELVNEQLDPGTVPRAEAAEAAAKARTKSAADYLEGVQEIDRDRRALMKLHAAQYRTQLDAEIVSREARLALLKTKLTVSRQLAERTRNDRPFAGLAPPEAMFVLSPDCSRRASRAPSAELRRDPPGRRLCGIQQALRWRTSAGPDHRSSMLGAWTAELLRTSRPCASREEPSIADRARGREAD